MALHAAMPPSLVDLSPTSGGCPKARHVVSLFRQPLVPVNGEREREQEENGPQWRGRLWNLALKVGEVWLLSTLDISECVKAPSILETIMLLRCCFSKFYTQHGCGI